MSTLFRLQEQCLLLMGHRAVEPTEGRNSTLQFKHIVYLLVASSAEYPLIWFVIYNRDDVELVTAGLSVSCTNLLTVIKVLTFLVYRQNFWQMVHSFRQIYPESHQRLVGQNYVQEANKLAALLGKAYCISCALTGFYFMLGPIVKSITSSWLGVAYVRELPMPMKFPFNVDHILGYSIGYVYTFFATFSVVIFASAIDGLFISFAINLRGHFQALQQRIQRLTFDLTDQAVQQKQLMEVVQYHVRLLELAKELRIIYTPIVFGQFLITSIQVGVIIYQIVTHLDSVMALIMNFSFCVSIMLQLFLYCYGGEIIKNESLQVVIAVQLSDWHLARPKQRRDLAFIMQRAQHLMLIKAGFYEASLANFLAILRAAMSLIAVIQSVE